MSHLVVILTALAVTTVALISDRLRRPRFERTHMTIIVLWVTAWGVAVLWWVSYTSRLEGWFSAADIALFGILGFLLGVGAISVIAFIARAISAETHARSALLIVVPLLLTAWLYFSYLHPQLA